MDLSGAALFGIFFIRKQTFIMTFAPSEDSEQPAIDVNFYKM